MAENRLEILKNLVVQNPADNFARYGLAMAYAAAGKHAQAVEEYTKLIEVNPVPPERLAGRFHQANVDEIVSQGTPEQVLRGKVVGPLDVPFVVGALGANPPTGQAIAHGQRKRDELVVAGGTFRNLSPRVADVIPERVPNGLRVDPDVHAALFLARAIGEAGRRHAGVQDGRGGGHAS